MPSDLCTNIQIKRKLCQLFLWPICLLKFLQFQGLQLFHRLLVICWHFPIHIFAWPFSVLHCHRCSPTRGLSILDYFQIRLMTCLFPIFSNLIYFLTNLFNFFSGTWSFFTHAKISTKIPPKSFKVHRWISITLKFKQITSNHFVLNQNHQFFTSILFFWLVLWMATPNSKPNSSNIASTLQWKV